MSQLEAPFCFAFCMALYVLGVACEQIESKLDFNQQSFSFLTSVSINFISAASTVIGAEFSFLMIDSLRI